MTDTSDTWRDFNDAGEQKSFKSDLPGKDELKAKLLGNLENTLFRLFPAGCLDKNTFKIGDKHGTAGESLTVEMAGKKAGLWNDFATGEGGDIIDLFAASQNLDARNRFPEVLDKLRSWLGEDTAPVKKAPAKRREKKPLTDSLGPYTAKYDYFDRNGKLIACVYRYDPPGKGKQFRPFNVKTGRYEAPDPRPLYNIPGIFKADTVILCEGEKCADALNQSGHCATTAMGGANTPLEKTDWSSLKGKHVLVWPDNDEAGKSYGQRVAPYLRQQGAGSVGMLVPPEDKPRKWDAADAAADGFEIDGFLKSAVSGDHTFKAPKVKVSKVREMLDDVTPMPPDLIGPRILGLGDVGVIAGAPKVGKSSFIMSAAMHWAAGEPFHGMTVARPLKILYLQAEIGYFFLRERLHGLDPDLLNNIQATENLAISDKFNVILNEEGIEEFARACLTAFADGPPDLLILDPLRNIFDGGSDGANENDNTAMIEFLNKRVVALRERVWSEMGIILVHHTRKMQKKLFEEDPFQALSGASSLRGFYTAGMVLHRPEMNVPQVKVYYELRNGPALKTKFIELKDGRWVELNDDVENLPNKTQARKNKSIDDHRVQKLIEILEKEAREEGKLFTRNALASKYKHTHGLGSSSTIDRTLKDMSVVGICKYTADYDQYDQLNTTSRDGYLVVEKMVVRLKDGSLKRVKPTHFMRDNKMILHPVENPDVWVYNLPEGGK